MKLPGRMMACRSSVREVHAQVCIATTYEDGSEKSNDATSRNSVISVMKQHRNNRQVGTHLVKSPAKVKHQDYCEPCIMMDVVPVLTVYTMSTSIVESVLCF